MVSDDKRSPLFVFPDPVTGPEMLSGAAFLYFQQPLLLSVPPVVLTEDSYTLLSLIEERKPEWGAVFLHLFECWRQQLDGSRKMLDAIAPLREKSFETIWLAYPANSDALERSNILATSSGLSLDLIANIIDPFNASGEIIRHIMQEAFLELDEDIEALFNYCGELFTRESLSHLLVKGYLLRIPMLTQNPGMPVLLTNERLTKFLNALPIEAAVKDTEEIENDIIAWELFRQIVSPHLDPLNTKHAKLIAEFLDSRTGEIERLCAKCLALADEVKHPSTLEKLPTQIERLIKTRVEKEIAELLRIDRRALNEFFTALFADEKTWLAVLTFISGIAANQIHLTTGAAIATLSLIGAKTFKAAADRRQKLIQSDYTLVYTIRRKA